MRLWTRLFRPSSAQSRADKLMKRGLAYVKKGRTSEAMKVAKELHSIHYSGGFEIEAQALARDGLKDEAITVLREGLNAAPTSWLNGNLLGNYLSDQGRFEEAFAAYEEALRTPSADHILIQANYAMALQRAGRKDDARTKIAEVAKQNLSKAEPGLKEFVESLADELKP
jgi:tetratricopeptide (TPR) repeat protein